MNAKARWVGGATVALLAATISACGMENDTSHGDPPVAPATPDVALAGAAWLESQLEGGLLVNQEHDTPDYSTTVDTAYALTAVDPESPALEAIAAAVADGVEDYALPGKEVYAGSLGKLLAFATDTGGDPHAFGGVDLVEELEDRTADRGAVAGRISDESEYGDYANSFGQAWAVRGLVNAGSSEADAARDFLLQQQCADGFFRLEFSAPGQEDQSCDAADPQAPPVDASALVVVLLHDLAGSEPALADALDRAVAWIADQQADDGSFDGGTASEGANANSTGLAGWALLRSGEEAEAENAAAWVRAHQVEGCEGGLADADGAIAFDEDTLQAGGRRGITAQASYQWRLATAQALPALLATPEDAEPAECPAAE